jgi:glucose-1-phosphate adenylyltransferase
MTPRIDEIREAYSEQLRTFQNRRSPDLFESVCGIVRAAAEDVAERLFDEMLPDPAVRRYLTPDRVENGLLESLADWIRDLFRRRSDSEIVAFIERQLRVGHVHAEANVPIRFMDRGIRILKREIHQRLTSSSLSRRDLGPAVASVGEILDIGSSLIRESFYSDILVREGEYRLQQALKRTLALVLAGGRGSRLGLLTAAQAKPAVPFGGKFRLIDFPLSSCLNSGIRRVGVLTQYRSHDLIQHVQRGWGFFRRELSEFIEIWPAHQQTPSGSWYRGTADATFQNLGTITAHDPDHVLVLAGDHVYKQDYSRMLAQHLERGTQVTVCCTEVSREMASSFGIVTVDANDNITGFVEKPTDPATIPGRPDRCLASMGIYIFEAGFLIRELRRDAGDPDSSHDFGKDLIPYLVGKSRMTAHRFEKSCIRNQGTGESYWRDVGTVDAYWAANMDLVTVTPPLDLYDPGWPIWTCQEQSPPAKFVFDEDGRRGHAVDSMVSSGCIVSGGIARRSLLFNDVRLHSQSLAEDSVILPRVDVGNGCRLRKAVVDRDCVLPAGLIVGEDPEEDARRFHRTRAGVTLITASALQRLSPGDRGPFSDLLRSVSSGGARSGRETPVASTPVGRGDGAYSRSAG